MNETSTAIAEVAPTKPANGSFLPVRKKALEIMAERLNLEPGKMMETLKHTVFKNATDHELAALVVVANEFGLSPFLKEIYAFPAKGGGIVPVISVDGWTKLANQHPQMDGLEFEWEHDEKTGALISCTAIIYRKDRTRPVKVTEYLEECRRPTDPWKMVHRMLRHKALIQCSRVAFGFSGAYDEDEGRDFADMQRADATVVEPKFRATPPELTAPTNGSGPIGDMPVATPAQTRTRRATTPAAAPLPKIEPTAEESAPATVPPAAVVLTPAGNEMAPLTPPAKETLSQERARLFSALNNRAVVEGFIVNSFIDWAETQNIAVNRAVPLDAQAMEVLREIHGWLEEAVAAIKAVAT